MNRDRFDAYLAAQRKITDIISRAGEASQADWIEFERAFLSYEAGWARPERVLHPREISERATFVRGSRVSEERV